MSYENEFPKTTDSYLKASNFQDQEIPLTYLGWEKKGNCDTTLKGQAVSWKGRLKFMLRYSYPEFAKDEAGETIEKNGVPLKNKHYDPNYPQGYTIVYHFEEGGLESGSLPLFNCFCFVRPSKGDFILLGKTGKDKETVWTLKKANVQTERIIGDSFTDDELKPDDNVPF